MIHADGAAGSVVEVRHGGSAAPRATSDTVSHAHSQNPCSATRELDRSPEWSRQRGLQALSARLDGRAPASSAKACALVTEAIRFPTVIIGLTLGALSEAFCIRIVDLARLPYRARPTDPRIRAGGARRWRHVEG